MTSSNHNRPTTFLKTSPEHLALEEAKKALVMVHGRGGSATDMLQFSRYFKLQDFAVLAPEATGHSWYPLSFMADESSNEPQLSQSLDTLDQTVAMINKAGIGAENIYFFGFSQGACLSLEYTARHAKRYGGVAAIIGGVIGQKVHPERYSGDFAGTPVFIGTSNPDFHVPITRVYATVNILRDLNAAVTLKEYPGLGHTINQDQIELTNRLIFDRQP
ncbi:phospholipase/carboxylesterase [Arachidicoccus rhizosphaerae]|uniref:Phospholipase/carboxylesterase n=1 Tax=Arachidicoccus rhizosphaerae TaxID=551991 RepID=A0A1H3VGE8_9BACT|nr:alpha/beta hydrolase [Arachidicoccus rhizosphaerae]SDZ73294.1 phospholipase/carboxylesterase [Arachidicoccus rhizosphaerae]